MKNDELPPDVTDPAITQTPSGARAAYNGTLWQLQHIVGDVSNSTNENFVAATGLLSDELMSITGPAKLSASDPLDLRALQDVSPSGVFPGLSAVRQRARQAIGLLGDYLPEETALRAHLYSIEAYADVMLAELFCSGIPLSTVDYQGDYTLRPGSTTTEVFTQAAALFDTALTLAGDSTRILNMSRVGKARALLGRGDYAAAAVAAAEVPDSFRYALYYSGVSGTRYGSIGIGSYVPGDPAQNYSGQGLWWSVGVSDGEGMNGLPYRSSDDPRVQVTPLDNGLYHPNKYSLEGKDTIVLASGVEARLIAAEAALQAGSSGWLDTLNRLRTDGTQDGGGTYTPGTGGVAGLAPLTDPDPSAAPGPTAPRVDLLFRERAFWLFLTGHRQGDMRRLVRQYHRPQSQVYPVGSDGNGGVYGPYIDAPVPLEEQTLNPLYTGCFSRD